jgi:hypothetical protein
MNFSCVGSEFVGASKRLREELPEKTVGKRNTEQDMDNKLAWLRFFNFH